MAKSEKIKKIDFTKKDLLSWEEIDEFCNEDEMLSLFVDDFKKLFEENFYLSDEETRKYISMIIANCPSEKIEQISQTVQNLANLDEDNKGFFSSEKGLYALIFRPQIFKELGYEPIVGQTDEERKIEIYNRIENFTEEDKKKFLKRLSCIDVSERRQEARKMVKKLIDFIINKTQNDETALPKDFYPILKRAKLFGIDPIKWVTLTNLKGMKLDKFNTMLHGIIGKVYENPFYKEGGAEPKNFKLFSLKDVQEVLQVSTLISLYRQKNVQPLINTLGDALKAYDKATSKDLSEFFRTYPTILLQNPVMIAENISALEKRFVETGYLTKAELAQEIIKKPSIVSCDPKKTQDFEDFYAVVLTELLEETGLVVEPDYVKKQVEKICYDFKQLDKIDGLKAEKIEGLNIVKDVLLSAVGAENALALMGDFNILNANPKYVDFIFKAAKFIQAEHPNGKNLVTYIASNTAQFFGKVEENDAIEKLHDVVNGNQKKERKPRTHSITIQHEGNTNSPEFSEVESALKKLSHDEKERAEATLQALLDFVKEKPQKAKNSFERANAITDERIEELMRQAEIECADSDDPIVELLTRYKYIYDEQNGKKFANICNIDEFIKGYQTFGRELDKIDFKLMCDFVSTLNFVYYSLRGDEFLPASTEQLKTAFKFLNENKESALKIMNTTLHQIDGFEAAKPILRTIKFEDFRSCHSKMDVAVSIICASIEKYAQIYFPTRKELIIPTKLWNDVNNSMLFDDQFIKVCTTTRVLFQKMTEFLSAYTTHDQMVEKNMQNSLNVRNFEHRPFYRGEFPTMMSGLNWRKQLSGILHYVIPQKRYQELVFRALNYSAEYMTNSGIVINETYIKCSDEELEGLSQIGITKQELNTEKVKYLSSRKEDIDYALHESLSNRIVETLLKSDRDLAGTDGSGK